MDKPAGAEFDAAVRSWGRQQRGQWRALLPGLCSQAVSPHSLLPGTASDKTGDGAALKAPPSAPQQVWLQVPVALVAPRLPRDHSGSADLWETCFSGSPI